MTELRVFPLVGPVPYLTEDCGVARRLIAGTKPAAAKLWYHGTNADALPGIFAQGLIPAWSRGGDSCAVFGESRLEQLTTRRRPIAIAVRSPRLEGQLKSWWVPPSCIDGAIVRGEFLRPAELLPPSPAVEVSAPGCACGLGPVVRDQQRLWLGSCEGRRGLEMPEERAGPRADADNDFGSTVFRNG